MAETGEATRSRTTTTPPPATTSSPPQPHSTSSSPCSGQDMKPPTDQLPVSPSVRNGFSGSASPVRGSEGGKGPYVCVDPALQVKEETGVKDESSAQDGPLDFSVRRRDSVSETFTDDSRNSSSVSPPGGAPYSFSSSSLRFYEQHPLPHAHPHPHPQAPPSSRHHHHHHNHHHHLSHQGRHGDGEGMERGLPHVGRSPESSPELIGQPKTAPRPPQGRGGGTPGGSRSPANPSLAALGAMAEGGAGGGMAPAAMATMLGQNGLGMGPMAHLSAVISGKPASGANGGKVQRPFKAYPKEVLQMPLGYLGLPSLNPFPGLEPGVGVGQEEMLVMYKQQLDMLRERERQMASMRTPHRSPPASSSSSSSSSTSTSSSLCVAGEGGENPAHASHPALSSDPAASLSSSATSSPSAPPPPPPPPPPPTSYISPPRSSSTTTTTAAATHPSPYPSFPPSNSSSSSSSSCTTITTPNRSSPFQPPATMPPLVSSSTAPGSAAALCSGSRKRPQSLPDSQKDDAYWERRRKNNDAAKRSRDARRAKEDEIALRAALLEQENIKLRVEVAALKTETARLRCLLYNS